MLKKRILLTAAVLTALCATGCASRKLTDSSFYGIELASKAESAKTIADLEVAPKKVIGQARVIMDMPPYKSGDRLRNFVLEREALLRALRAGDSSGIGADVLVGAQFHYVRTGDELIVTVVGYPARYKNFRPESGSGSRDDVFTVENVGGVSVIGYDPSSTTVEESGNNLVFSGSKGAAKPSVSTMSAATPAAPAPAEPAAPRPVPQEMHPDAQGVPPATNSEEE
jgi:hypothetical protein